MRFHLIKTCLSLLIILTIAGSCQHHVVNTIIPNKNTDTNQVKSKTFLDGTANFPGENEFKTKTIEETVRSSAIVSILYPANHETFPNKTIAVGLTNSFGGFSINPLPSFQPGLNEIFVLQAEKRTEGIGNSVMTIRTYLKWNGNSWESITYQGIVINKETTALSIIEKNDDTVNPSDIIGKIHITGSGNILSDINPNVTIQVINEVSDLVTEVLAKNLDPIQYIEFGGKKYLIANPKPVATLSDDLILYTEKTQGTSGGSSGPCFPGSPNFPSCLFPCTPISPFFPQCLQNSGSSTPTKIDLFSVDVNTGIKIQLHHFEASTSQNININNVYLAAQKKNVIFKYQKSGNNGVFIDELGRELQNQTELNTSRTSNISSLVPSPDKTKFLIITSDNKIYLTDGTPGYTNQVFTNISFSGLANISWSPDSSKISFKANNGNRSDLFVSFIDGLNAGTPVNVSSGQGTANDGPTLIGYWSQDSNKIFFDIAFYSQIPDIRNLYVARFNGKSFVGTANVSDGVSYNVFNAELSPDSSKIIWGNSSPDGRQDVYVSDVDGSNRKALTTGIDFADLTDWLIWSPDSRKVGFRGTTNRYNTYVAEADGTALYNISKSAGEATFRPYFSKDSTKVLFEVHIDTPPETYQIYSANSNGTGNPVQITSGTFSDFSPNLSTPHPRGEKFVIKTDNQIYMINSDGTGITDLGMTPPQFLGWHPDGNRIFYYVNNDIWIMNTDGTNKINLSNNPGKAKGNIGMFFRKD